MNRADKICYECKCIIKYEDTYFYENSICSTYCEDMANFPEYEQLAVQTKMPISSSGQDATLNCEVETWVRLPLSVLINKQIKQCVNYSKR